MLPIDPILRPRELPGRCWLAGVQVPPALLEQPARERVALLLDGGRIAAVAARPGGDAPVFDLDGAFATSAYVEPHTHLDKGDLLATGMAPQRTLWGAIEAVRSAAPAWTADALARRIGFGLREAHASGCRAVNTYCDWPSAQAPQAWEVLQQARRDWAGRIDLVLTCLVPIDLLADAVDGEALARAVKAAGGVLGLFVPGRPGAIALLPRAFSLAARHGLRLDLHIDEHLDAGFAATPVAARLAQEQDMGQRTVFGHACALSLLRDKLVLETLDCMAQAGVHLVSLPLTNLYLQDHSQAQGASAPALPSTAMEAMPRTPRLRGLAPVREAAARGVGVSFGCDNHRDPFFPYGDLDPLRTLAFAAVVAQLDAPATDWLASLTLQPARALGLPWDGVLRPGAPADLVLHPGRNAHELLSRPEQGRLVLRAGQRLQARRPDPRELDDLATP